MSLRELEPLKTSRYVSVLQMANGDAVVFSGMSGAALKVTLDKRPEYDSLCANRRISDSPLVNLAYDRVRRKFVTAMILVPHELDEIAYLENQFHGTLYVDTTLHMTLVPTLNCNLACPYCYNASRHGTMDERLIEDIGLFAERNVSRKTQRLSVAWVGGEPLLRYDVMGRLARRLGAVAAARGCTVEGSLVTNGTLLTPDIIAALGRAPFYINQVQVTLDGPKAVHDRSRTDAHGKPTFDLICENLKLLSAQIRTSVRISVTAGFTVNTFRTLMDEIFEREVIQPKISFYLGKINPTGKLSPDDPLIMPKAEFARLELECAKAAKERQFPLPLTPASPRTLSCGLLKAKSFVLEPSGCVNKCWDEVGKTDKLPKVWGNPALAVEPAWRKLCDYNPFRRDKCVQCPVLPLCEGGCPHYSMLDPEGMFSEECIPERFNLRDRLAFLYG
jgi:uncharacterized protein